MSNFCESVRYISDVRTEMLVIVKRVNRSVSKMSQGSVKALPCRNHAATLDVVWVQNVEFALVTMAAWRW